MSTLLLFNRSHGKQKYHSHVSYLCFFYCRITRDRMMMMMIRHTAQSSTVRSSLVLPFLLIYLSRYPLLARLSCARYHNSDISLFFAFSLIHTDSTPSCERGEKKERSATLMNSSFSRFLLSVQHTYNTHKFSFPA